MANRQKIITWILYAALGIGALWLVFRFAMPWIAPFILALATARLIEPWVKWLMAKAHFKRGFSSVVCSILVLAILITVLCLAINRLTTGVSAFVQSLPELAGQLSHTFSKMESRLYQFVIAAPVEAQAIIKSTISSFSTMLESLPSQLTSSLISLAKNIASAFPKIFLFSVTYAISVLFMSASYPQIISFIMRQIPDKWHDRVRVFKRSLSDTFCKWCKAQAMLMGVTFLELAVGLTVLRVPYGIFLAALIALVDALPVFGTGTILIPWGAFSLIGGHFTLGVGLLLIYCITSLVRSFIEPRFVGGQVGLHPVATLMAMYIGYCTVGVVGMVLFPLALILLKQLNDSGYIKLWK